MARWDIFCKVIDNYGDIGVCWRLARQLVVEYGQNVRLWLDDVSSLVAIWPEANITPNVQTVTGVEVVRWSEDCIDDSIEIADVIIEAFACGVPNVYQRKMVAQKDSTGRAPYWINLEYLTAEAWALGCHLLSSPQAGGINRIFFFPGFSDKTGGLLREHDLLKHRDALDKHRRWHELTGFVLDTNALKITLFGYERMPLCDWLPCLIDSVHPVQLAVTAGQASTAMRSIWQHLGLKESWRQGALSVRFVPMLAQNVFDELLWASDLNCVRGEDSFVRALWAGVPLVWHIYEQDDGAHWPKLDAFIHEYADSFATDTASSCEAWSNWLRFWNGDTRFNARDAWRALMHEWLDLKHHAHTKTEQWAQVDGLAQQLVRRYGVYGQNSL